MGGGVRIICTICARGGSKGLPGKNLRPLAGKPLIAHTVLQAKEAGIFDAVAVSSESRAILEAGREWGADHAIERPAEMATDSASKMPAIQHCVRAVEERTGAKFDVITDLDPTSPLRNADDIRGAVRLLTTNNATSVITGAPARKNPYFNLVERAADGHVALSKSPPPGLFRRQDCPPCFDMNAAVYVWRRDAFMETPEVFYDDTLLYEMPPERSHDIDTPLDFEWVAFVMSRQARP